MAYPKKYKSRYFKEAVEIPHAICFCEPGTPQAEKIKVEYDEGMESYMLYVTPVYNGALDFIKRNTNRSGAIDWVLEE